MFDNVEGVHRAIFACAFRYGVQGPNGSDGN